MPVHSSISEETFLRVAQVFDWATKAHYVMWFTDKNSLRHRRIEILLRRLTDKHKLRVTAYKNRLVYITPRRRGEMSEFNISHGLGVTDGLVRLILSDRSAEIIPERRYRSRVRPEFGLVYGQKSILYEFCTCDNARRNNILKYKIRNYQDFISPDQIVLFVLQIPREEVKRKVRLLKPEGNFFFTDYQTFL